LTTFAVFHGIIKEVGKCDRITKFSEVFCLAKGDAQYPIASLRQKRVRGGTFLGVDNIFPRTRKMA
jgi:hypothetical protein